MQLKSVARAWALAVALVAVGAPATEGPPPDELVRTTAEQVFEVLRGDGDTNALAEVVDTKVVDKFDFGAMTRLAVGKHWRSADAAEQEALVAEFRTLLVRTYSVALKSFVDYDIDYRPLTLEPDARQATVQTVVSKDGGGKPIRMDYRMLARPEGWKVYDVLVDGVSLVVNYRSTFDIEVVRGGVAGLLRLLREKNAAGTTG